MRILLVLLASAAALLSAVDARACSPAPGWTAGPPTYYIDTVTEEDIDRGFGTAPGTYLMSRGGPCNQQFDIHGPVGPLYQAIARPIQWLSLIGLLLCGIAWFAALASWIRRRRNGGEAPAWVAHTNDPLMVMTLGILLGSIVRRMEIPARLYCDPHRLMPEGIAVLVIVLVAAAGARVALGRRGRGRLGGFTAATVMVVGMMVVSTIGFAPPPAGKCDEEARYVEVKF